MYDILHAFVENLWRKVALIICEVSIACALHRSEFWARQLFK